MLKFLICHMGKQIFFIYTLFIIMSNIQVI